MSSSVGTSRLNGGTLPNDDNVQGVTNFVIGICNELQSFQCCKNAGCLVFVRMSRLKFKSPVIIMSCVFSIVSSK